MAIGDDSRTRFLLFWDCKDWNEEGACDAFELHRGPSRAKIKTRFSRELDERVTYHQQRDPASSGEHGYLEG